MPERKRKYPSKKKTTTTEGYREYKKLQMREVRKQQKQSMAELKRNLRQLQIRRPKVYKEFFGNSLGLFNSRQTKKRRSKRRK